MGKPEPSKSQAAFARIIVLVAIAWAPLMLLSLPTWLRTGHVDPLLRGAEVHARLVLALGLVGFAGVVLERRIAICLRSITDDGVTPGASGPDWFLDFHRRRPAAGVGLLTVAWLTLSYAVPLLIYRRVLPSSGLRWVAGMVHAGPSEAGASLSWWWYVLVSQPLLLLVLGAWVLRWLQWSLLLWRLARSGPVVHAGHTDGAGGLGFLRLPVDGLRGFLLGLAITIAAVWFDEIAAGRAKSSTFVGDVIGFLIVSLALLYGPYLAFTPVLVRVRDRGMIEYTALMRRYLERFEARWFDPRSDTRAQLLGNEDMSALADLGASAAVVEQMRVTIPKLVDLRSVLIAAALPFVVVALAYGPSTAELLRSLVQRFLAP